MEGGMLEYQTFSTYGCGLIQDEQTRGCLLYTSDAADE